MKKFSIMFFVALATLVSCSKNFAPESSEQNNWVNDITLPVPIELGGSSFGTKASPINNLTDFAGKTFGVFATDKSASAWSTSDDSVYLNNEKAYSEADGKVYFGTSASNRKTLYYPLLSNVNLSFYAYYTYRGADISAAELVPTVTESQITSTVYLGSTDDILWAKSVATPVTYSPDGASPKTYDGFNAAYIRTLAKIEAADSSKPASANKPKLIFKHPASAIKFSAIKVEDQSYSQHQDIEVENLTLSNIPSKATLCIADRVNSENEGKLIAAVETVENLRLSKSGDLNLSLPTSKTELGYMYVMPQDGVETINGYISVTVNSKRQNIPFTIDPAKMGAVTNGFKAGYIYNILITVHEALEIEITADIEQYQDAFVQNGNPDDGDIVIE